MCYLAALKRMAQRDHYEVLGVGEQSTPEEIKSAFKRLVEQVAPRPPPRRPRRARTVQGDHRSPTRSCPTTNRRHMYDRLGHRAEEPGSPFGPSGPFPGGFVDISDIAIDGILGDLLGVFGVGRGEKGDIKQDLEIDFEEAAFGCEKQLRYERVVSCNDCHGSGRRGRHGARGVRRVQRTRARALPAGHLPHRRRADVLALPRLGPAACVTRARCAAAAASCRPPSRSR